MRLFVTLAFGLRLILLFFQHPAVPFILKLHPEKIMELAALSALSFQ